MHNDAPQEMEQPQQEYTNAPQNNGIDWGGDIQRFFKEDLKEMFLSIFKRPATGTQLWLDNTKSKSVVNPLCMIVSAFVLITLVAFIALRIKIGSSVSFGSCLGLGLMPIFFSLFISLFMFIFMAIKQKPDMMLAFRHSSIHVLILTIAMILSLITLLVFIDQRALLGLMFGRVSSGLGFGALILMLVMVYALSMGFSAARQTLKTCQSDDKEGFSWYTAPLVVFLSIYLTYFIVSAML